MARANTGVVRQVGRAGTRRARRWSEHVQHVEPGQVAAQALHQRRVRGVRADEHGAPDPAVIVEDDALPHASRAVRDDDVVTVGMRIADTSDLDAEQLERGRRVGAFEGGVAAAQTIDDDRRHCIARCDQAVDATAMAGDLADGEDVGRRCRAPVIDDDAAPLADGQARRPTELIARADAGSEHDEIGVEFRPIGERQPDDFVGWPRAHRRCRGTGADVQAQRFDVSSQRPAATVVELHRHQPRRELDDRCRQAEQAQCVRRFQTEQPASDDRGRTTSRRPLSDGVEIIERPVHEHAAGIGARDRRHERHRASSQHADVVSDDPAGGSRRDAPVRVERHDGVTEHELDVVGEVRRAVAEREVVGRGIVEHRRQVHPVVGPPPFVADDDDAMALRHTAFDGELDEAMTDHAVADDEQRRQHRQRQRRRTAHQTPANRCEERRTYTVHVTIKQTT